MFELIKIKIILSNFDNFICFCKIVFRYGLRYERDTVTNKSTPVKNMTNFIWNFFINLWNRLRHKVDKNTF